MRFRLNLHKSATLPPKLERVAALTTMSVLRGAITQLETKMHKGTMRNSLLALAGFSGVVVLGSGAIAADLKTPVFKAPPAGVLPTAYDWTGFYVGAHVGYGWGRTNWRDAAGLNVTDSSNGVMGGAQAGFNY